MHCKCKNLYQVCLNLNCSINPKLESSYPSLWDRNDKEPELCTHHSPLPMVTDTNEDITIIIRIIIIIVMETREKYCNSFGSHFSCELFYLTSLLGIRGHVSHGMSRRLIHLGKYERVPQHQTVPSEKVKAGPCREWNLQTSTSWSDSLFANSHSSLSWSLTIWNNTLIL